LKDRGRFKLGRPSEAKIIPTEKERTVLDIIRGIEEDEVIVEVEDGQPVTVTVVREIILNRKPF
jgi:hypothetical protein